MVVGALASYVSYCTVLRREMVGELVIHFSSPFAFTSHSNGQPLRALKPLVLYLARLVSDRTESPNNSRTRTPSVGNFGLVRSHVDYTVILL